MLLEEDHDLKKFYRRLVVIIVVSTFVLYLGVWQFARDAYLESIRVKAQTYVDLVLTVREWNSENKGAWVSGRSDPVESRYLRTRGVDDETRTVDGNSLVLIDPYTMIGEIADLSTDNDSVRFRLISRTPINPDNTPDAWESTALENIDDGDEWFEAFVDTDDEEQEYRFVTPLFAQRSCLDCHSQPTGPGARAYIGAFSIAMPAETMRLTLRNLMVLLIIAWIATAGVTLFVVRTMMGRLKAELREMNKDLRRAATIDPLTGLANRQVTLSRLKEEFERSKRSGGALSIIEFDLDHFKSVNDTHGHLVGDKVLRHFAVTASSGIRPYDLLGRVGGEEFLLVAPNSDLEDATALAERVLAIFRSQHAEHQGSPLRTTASAGVASIAESDETPEFLLERADEALYRAKQAGRDRVSQSKD